MRCLIKRSIETIDQQWSWIKHVPENAVRIRLACDEIDVSDDLPKIRVKMLVLHARHDNIVPFDYGRSVAAGIAGARFVALETANHIPVPGEVAWTAFVHKRHVRRKRPFPLSPDN